MAVHIGNIKWFGDKSRNASYGFIHHDDFGGIFFHAKSVVKNVDIERLQENVLVIFDIRLSKKHTDKYEAINVKLLEDENDLGSLFDLLLSDFDKNKLVLGLVRHITKMYRIFLDLNIKQRCLNLYLTHIKNKIYDSNIDELKFDLNLAKEIFDRDYQDEMISQLELKEDILFNLWVDGYTKYYPENYIITHFFDLIKNPNFLLKIENSINNEIVEKVILNFYYEDNLESFFTLLFLDVNKIKQSSELFKNLAKIYENFPDLIMKKVFFDSYCAYLKNKNYGIKLLKSNLKLAKKIFNEDYRKILVDDLGLNDVVIYYLWLDEYVESYPENYVITNFFDLIRGSIFFKRCDNLMIEGIIEKVIINFKDESIDMGFCELDETFTILKDRGIGNLFSLIDIISDENNLKLFISNKHDFLDFDRYKNYVTSLNYAEQKKFLKKIFYKIYLGDIEIKLDQLVEVKFSDYSINLILEILKKLGEDSQIRRFDLRNRIFEIIINYIEKPNELLKIEGFFDECRGRTQEKEKTIQSEKNEGFFSGGWGRTQEKTIQSEDGDINYELIHNEQDKPKKHLFCDARKAINQTTGENTLSKGGNLFWWCGNKPCFKSALELHGDEWEKYTLLDFLDILKINFKRNDLELCLATINKANMFLEHLICRSCGYVLHPKNQSNYAIDRISNFICRNKNCSIQGEEIYLTHCLNGYCEAPIDSRDTVRCKPIGSNRAMKGWYICKECHACCSDEGLKRRYENWKQFHPNQEYFGYFKGHREQGIVCCNTCGNPFIKKEHQEEQYQEILMWFQKNKDNSLYIGKYGVNRNGGHWFTFRRHSMTEEEFRENIISCYRAGFNVPDISQKKDMYLIAESSRVEDGYFCLNCNCVLDLKDNEQKNAFKKWWSNE